MGMRELNVHAPKLKVLQVFFDLDSSYLTTPKKNTHVLKLRNPAHHIILRVAQVTVLRRFSMSTFLTGFLKEASVSELLICAYLVWIILQGQYTMYLYSTSHGHCSITRMFHAWKSAMLHTNSTRKTSVKHSWKNIHAKIHEKIHAN